MKGKLRMIKRLTALMMALVLCLGGFPCEEAAAAIKDDVGGSGTIAVVSASQEKVLRRMGKTADLSQLAADEYYSFVWDMEYNGAKEVKVKNFYVRVDGGPKWYWATKKLTPGDRYPLHIYNGNMQTCMTEGEHKVTWYINGKAVKTETFTFTAPVSWPSRLPFPSGAEIAETNRTATVRSPYIYGWEDIGAKQRYTEIAADFKADYVPKATYCALFNLKVDISPLKKKYKNIRNEYEALNLYAGFQRRWNENVTIMSMWDTYYEDQKGVRHTLRAKALYPEKPIIGNGAFTGEGEGTQMLMPFEWQAGRWYRMLLQCKRGENGTTHIEQWVCDLETNEWTMTAKIDTGIKDTCFVGNNCFFLENFDPKYAGEIRAMEVKNVRVRDSKSGKWKAVKSAFIGSNGGLPHYNGSYAYGADRSSFWMITSGVGGDWYGTKKVPANNKTYTVKNAATQSPY